MLFQREAPKPWAKVDWTHPLSSGLLSYMIPIGGTRTWIDLVDGSIRRQPALFGDTPPLATRFGIASVSGANADEAVPDFTLSLPVGTGFAIMAVMTPLNQTANSGAGTIIKLGSSNTADQFCTMRMTSNTAILAEGPAVGSVNGTVTVGLPSVVVARCSTLSFSLAIDGAWRQVRTTVNPYAGDGVVSLMASRYAAYNAIAIFGEAAPRFRAADSELAADPFAMLEW